MFPQRIETIRARVNARLSDLTVCSDLRSAPLSEATRYALLAPGKRVRAILAMLTAEAVNGSSDAALDPACAMEMVHTASLVLDDMPCMDDAGLRRGRQACHRVYGADVALLASFGLLNRAFAVIAAAPDLRAETRVELVRLLSHVVGDEGLIAGQLLDLHPPLAGLGTNGNGAAHGKGKGVELVAGQKTASLFVACAEAGARAGEGGEQHLDRIRRYAWNIGLAFQVVDDLVDRNGTVAQAGKGVGMDAHKITYVSVFGAKGAMLQAEAYVEAGMTALQPLGERAEPLHMLARHVLDSCVAGLPTR